MVKVRHHLGEFRDPLSNYEPVEYADVLERALVEETIAAIQTRPYVQISPDHAVYRALQVLAGLRISSLLVVQDGKLVGVFTERDTLQRVASRYREIHTMQVADVMTCDPVVVYETDPAATALGAIVAAGYRHVPVLDLQEQVVGVISPRRVLAFLQDRHRHPLQPKLEERVR